MSATLLKMAFLNLNRNLRRTLITLSGIAIGTGCAYLFYGYMQHTYRGLAERFARSGNGHVQIAQSPWFKSAEPERYRTSAETFQKVVDQLMTDPQMKEKIAAISLKRKISGIVSTGERSEVFVAQGIDPIANYEMSSWVRVVEGKNLEPKPFSDNVLLGKVLADRLGATPGQNVSLLLTTDEGRTNALDLTVSGLTQSVSKDADAVALVLPIEMAFNLVRSRMADVLLIGLHDTDDTDLVLGKAQAVLSALAAQDPEVAKLNALPWPAVAEFYQSVKELYSRIFDFVQLVLALVTLLATTNTIVMAVSERRSEIAMLRAIGMKQRQIRWQFIHEGWMLGLLGAISGLLLAHGLSFVVKLAGGISMPPPPGSSQGYQLFFVLSPIGGAVIAALATLSATAASLIPARSAARQNIAGGLLSGLALCFLVGTFGARPAMAKSIDPGTLLTSVDQLRHVPADGFELKTTFTNLNKGAPGGDVGVTYQVVGAGTRVLALAVSDPPSDRMAILSSEGGMWMQKEGMRKAIRISPGQRLIGQASNADVINVRFSQDYIAQAWQANELRLTLVPKTESSSAAYAKIELELVDTSGKIKKGSFYAISGKLLKTVEYTYAKQSDGKERLTVSTISDAIRTDWKTRVEHGPAKSRQEPSAFFNPDNILASAKKMGRE